MKRIIRRKRFMRSIDEHIQYYRDRSIKERMQDTLLISNLCLKLMQAGKKAKFNGR